ncbi:MAG: NifU family protein [Deltaproteobacteria bacterium]|nr:NifU family protein [Deltaproteobacteria bacterium]
MESAIHISVQPTPNPNTLKFVVNTLLLEEGTADFSSREEAAGSPLALKLFDVPSVAAVFVGLNFISVTKTPTANWNELANPLTTTIRSALVEGLGVTATTKASVASEGSDRDVEQRVRDILDREIRPAVAMDGGDITFHSYKDGIVTLHLQGACSSCPSSVLTLRMGVEHRLREMIPEVKEVVQV